MNSTGQRGNFVAALRLLLLLSWPSLPAHFDLTVEPEAGFQTNVPNGPVDSSFGSHAFCTVGLEPSWSTDTGNTFRFVFTGPLNATKYMGGPGEAAIAPEFSIEKHVASHVTQAALGAAYHLMPVAYDPTVPEKYMEYSLRFEREQSWRIASAVMYALQLVDDIATSRKDFKNTVQFRLRRCNSARLHSFVRIGCSWNISNTEGAGYVQPFAADGMTLAVDERNLLLFHLFAAYSFYKPMNISVLVPGRGQGKNATVITYELSEPRIPFATLYCGYDRELTLHASFHFYYMAVLFGRGEPGSLLFSHQTGIIFSWRRK